MGLMGQHMRWQAARARLWSGKEPHPEPKPPRPVSPFLREVLTADGHRRRARAEDVEKAMSFVGPGTKILREVARKHNLCAADLQGKSQRRNIANARHEACYRMSKETSLTLPQMGALLGGRDHTTMLHSIRLYAALVEKPVAEGPRDWFLPPAVFYDDCLAAPIEVPRLILLSVARKHGVTVDDMLSLRRKRCLSPARQEAAWLMRKLTPLTLPQIGRELGRDHTSALYAIARHERRLAEQGAS